MSDSAWLVCERTRESFNLGKWPSIWCPVDWSKTDLHTLTQRVRAAYCGEHDEYVVDGCTVEHAEAVARAVFAVCEEQSWEIAVRAEDYYFDRGPYREIGSRWKL